MPPEGKRSRNSSEAGTQAKQELKRSRNSSNGYSWVVGTVAVFMIFGGGALIGNLIGNLIGKWIEGENEVKRIRAENEFGKGGDSPIILQEIRQEIRQGNSDFARNDNALRHGL